MNHTSFDLAYKNSLHILFREGRPLQHRLGPAIELFGGDTIVLSFNPTKYKLLDSKIDYIFAESYADAVVRGDTDLGRIEHLSERAKTFGILPKGMPEGFTTLYGPRLKATESKCLELLLKDSSTCRAVQPVLIATDYLLLEHSDNTAEFSCVDSLHWAIRDGELNLHIHMRSSNCYKILPIDVCIFAKYYKYMQSKLGEIVDGKISMSFGSMHIFERDLDAVKEYLRC